MRIEISTVLPAAAREIREAVFVEEQRFTDEFDDIDDISHHLVLYQGKTPAAVSRIYWDDAMGAYILGRVAVSRALRRQGLGAAIVKAAEEQVRKLGGRALHLHAQCRITAFYEAIGYSQYGPIEDDQGCPHIWMQKQL